MYSTDTATFRKGSDYPSLSLASTDSDQYATCAALSSVSASGSQLPVSSNPMRLSPSHGPRSVSRSFGSRLTKSEAEITSASRYSATSSGSSLEESKLVRRSSNCHSKNSYSCSVKKSFPGDVSPSSGSQGSGSVSKACSTPAPRQKSLQPNSSSISPKSPSSHQNQSSASLRSFLANLPLQLATTTSQASPSSISHSKTRCDCQPICATKGSSPVSSMNQTDTIDFYKSHTGVRSSIDSRLTVLPPLQLQTEDVNCLDAVCPFAGRCCRLPKWSLRPFNFGGQSASKIGGEDSSYMMSIYYGRSSGRMSSLKLKPWITSRRYWRSVFCCEE